jgi:multidrug/hemolysin transport system permease protein
MNTLISLVKRNTKLFFKDKGLFLTSLITPAILLVLYISFLGNVYEDTFLMNIPNSEMLPEKLINGLVGSQLISSILSVSCITVAFCSNFLMVQDKANGSIKDLMITPVKPSVLALGYYLSTLISTLIICLTATAICLIYVAIIGWYLSIYDVLLLILDVFLLVMFGTAISSIISYFLSSQGQISAVGTIVSSGYGFICGAYMPISTFGNTLQKVLSFLPGTYGTSLVRNHSMNGALKALEDEGVSPELINELRDAMDLNLYFFDNEVKLSTMFLIVSVSTLLLILSYVFINKLKVKKNK